jgi:ClpP class serine protease
MTSAWLVTASALAEIRALQRTYARAPELRAAASTGGLPRIASVTGSTMTIAIEGVLTKHRDPLLAMFGGGNTTYSDVIAAVASAQRDPAVSAIVLDVASPGGSIEGLFDCLSALETSAKPVTLARCSMACSAAYALAATARKIEAANVAASFGSIGVAMTLYVDPDVVHIASSDAPDKRPDVTTSEGKASIRRHLDDVHELFVDAVARGRRTTAARVNADFGRGGVVLARAAKSKGMIDAVPGTPTSTTSWSARAMATQSDADFADAVAEKLRERFGMAPAAAAGPGDDDTDDDGGAIPLAAVDADFDDKVAAILRTRLGKS